MVLALDVDLTEKVEFPRLLHLCSAFALRYPFTSVLLILLEAFAGAVMLKYTNLPSVWGTAGLLMIVLLACLLVWVAVLIQSSSLLGDLVDFVGESEFRACLAQANKEVLAGIIPAGVVGVLPLLCYFLELRTNMETRGDAEKGIIYGVVATTTLVGPVCGIYQFSGPAELVRLVSALLKAATRQHFDNLEAALTREGLSQQERTKELDGHCKRVLHIFEKANKCITARIFSGVVLANLVALVTVLQLVVAVRAGEHTTFQLFLWGGLSPVATATGLILLHSMTTVADQYEDLAARLSLNLELRFRLTEAFPGPPGVKLLSSFENDHVNDLSFNFHHRPLNASVMEGTLIRLFMGALVSVCLGILTRPASQGSCTAACCELQLPGANFSGSERS